MNRRRLLQSAAALAGTLYLPPPLHENVEAVRRYWALDRTMLATPPQPVAYVESWTRAWSLGFYVWEPAETEGEYIPFLSDRDGDLYAALSPQDQRTFPRPYPFDWSGSPEGIRQHGPKLVLL